MSDEGIGIRVAEKIAKIKEELENLFDVKLEVYDGGNLNFQLLEYMDGADIVIFVDAVDFDGNAGEVRIFEVSKIEGPEFFGIHDLDYTKVISVAKTCGIKVPEKIYVVGIKPEKVKEGLELSEKVSESVDKAIKLIFDFIKKINQES